MDPLEPHSPTDVEGLMGSICHSEKVLPLLVKLNSYMDHWREGWLDFLGAARDYVAAVLLVLEVASILSSDCKIQYDAFFVPALGLNL